MATRYRTHTCGELRVAQIGAQVRLSGWVHSIRDHGGVIFLDLRDHYGLTQVVVDAEAEEAVRVAAAGVKPESVVMVGGQVVARGEEACNPRLPTGEIEVRCTAFSVDALTPALPFPIAEEVKAPEELRLKYRFLDLRRQRLHRNILLRAQVIAEMRRYLHAQGFVEYQTPILTVSSPEGARDYLVPSRLHPGHFYALPQAPQQYKQLIMCAGFDRYFQIAPCFRDEDARADRSPGEFYQLDIEMSFIDQEDLFAVVEGLFTQLTAAVSSKQMLALPFPRITYHDALDRYGIDKPDLRFALPLQDITGIFHHTSFAAFAAQQCVKAIVAPGAAHQPRSFFDRLDATAKEWGAKGLSYLLCRDGQLAGPLAKHLSSEELQELRQALSLDDGDAALCCAGGWQQTCEALGKVRLQLAAELQLIPADVLAFCWVVDFPMYVRNEETRQPEFFHNPFSMLQGGLAALQQQDPLEILAYQYDLVCNGIELSSGAIRNHRPDIMYKAFEIAGYRAEEVEEQFGHLLNAFRYGAPPHGGLAPGIDRIVMIYADEPNLREVIMFPMNQQAQELMVGSPAVASEGQLRELGLRVV